MQHIDNDMDDLFNKAGRDYPLKTDNGNWDAVFGKLQQPPPASTPLTPKTNGRYYWFLLLLLLPLGYLLIGDNKQNKITKNDQKKSSVTANENTAIDQQTGNNKIAGSKTADNKIPGNTGAGTDGSTIDDKKTVENSIADRNTSLFEKNTPVAEKNTPVANRNTVKLNNNSKPDRIGKRTRNRLFPFEKGESRTAHDEILRGGFPSPRDFTFHEIPISYTLSPYSITPPPIENQSSQSGETEKPNKPKQIKTSKLYAGLLAGPDLSTVKYQKLSNAGYSIGVLAGYKFSSRWSVEAGVLYNRKKYYTDGKYFDKARTNIPPSVYIDYLDGVCEMFEVPVSVRYNFSTKENTIFATAGVTSYFMNEEEYHYWAWSGGAGYQGYKSYDNSGNHFFSNMQFSIGYNYKLSNKLNLRVEPYIKIPVRNIGIGNLPITSTGVYFGIMRKIR